LTAGLEFEMLVLRDGVEAFTDFLPPARKAGLVAIFFTVLDLLRVEDGLRSFLSVTFFFAGFPDFIFLVLPASAVLSL